MKLNLERICDKLFPKWYSSLFIDTFVQSCLQLVSLVNFYLVLWGGCIYKKYTEIGQRVGFSEGLGQTEM
jgi:hypothetical protein